MNAVERKLEIARMRREELNSHTFLCEREQEEYEELIKYQKGLIESQAKYIGFLQSCVRSGEKWEGNIDDFIKRLSGE